MSQQRQDTRQTSAGAGGEDGGAANGLPFHRLHHALTAFILASFVLIVIMTTASTGAFVVTAGKILYLLILLSALTWLATWLVKVWRERHPAGE